MEELADRLRRALVDDLVERGVIRSEVWRRAFERVPRHHFVPAFYEWEEGAPPPSAPLELATDPLGLLPRIYADDPLPTEMEDSRITSSSSKPSMMAAFLEALEVEDGNAALEIGTGTGYNAALLCERLGSERVTTIDVVPDLVERARARLAACGYEPVVAVADGADGYPPRAPYDRIVATCSVERIPPAWREQLRPGGVVVAPLCGDRFAAGLVALRRQPDGSLVGRLRPELAAFMPLRRPERNLAPARSSRDEIMAVLEAAAADGRTAGVPGWLSLGPDTFNAGLLFRLHAPDVEVRWRRAGGGWGGYVDASRRTGIALLGRQDGSWARADLGSDGSARIAQGGRRRLWDLLEWCWGLYVGKGRPGPERYGWTVWPDGGQVVWLDHPGSEHRWEL